MSKNKIGIVVGREYFTRIKKPSFYLLTLLMPLVFVALISLPIILGNVSKGKETVAVLDEVGIYAPAIKSNATYTFVQTRKTLEELQAEGVKNDENFTAVLHITDSLHKDPKALALYGFKQVPGDVADYIAKMLEPMVRDKIISQYDIPHLKEIIQESNLSLRVGSYIWSEEGGEAKRSSGSLAAMIAFALGMLSFVFVSTYGGMVMSGVLEEKKSRIMEVMVSSVRPFELMAGKIIGIGLVGITQIVVWIFFTGILFLVGSKLLLGGIYDAASISQLNPADLSGFANQLDTEDLQEIGNILGLVQSLNIGNILLMFLLCFIGGYLLYAALYAAVGSAVSTDEDSSQFIMPMMLLQLFAFYAGMGSIRNPEGPLAFWCSFIPFTSPICMLIRIPYGVPLWQQALAMVLLFASVVAVIWIAAKIYRIGILMYGKKPSFKDMIHWMKY